MNKTQVRMLAVTAAALLACAAAQAGNDFKVTVATTVFSTDTQTGIRDLMPNGSPVQLSFMVDSSRSINSAFFPTRGYMIDMSTLSFTINGLAITVDAPSSPLYFVMRNNDPGVDGVYVSQGPDDVTDLNVHVPGSSYTYVTHYTETWTGGNQFSSLNIAENTGSWGTPNISVFGFGLELPGGYRAASFNIPTLTVTAVPEPTTTALMGLGLGLFSLLAAARRRRN